ncbi:MAG: 50S ribosomal protein L23 [Candidatus Doudnabacteria bacterium CG10_big_fil_rev_8_21_14_0_10_41_10]|uniref:Large ribosomal subunit protein uL23 n=1 Tax=Candidatus Doudnabacteria bacterium CG10_big_fil_rev_8_21_14_0_10_41_10 TaxID=1974551 RepID=A0A2H0VDJ6_9BACT|nr:MAG: 50S ribosomal protein L23 [Candidatus Doudnabacteria bacterium CG10_big_fil_rev_8_21_14_0_10_41_10]
MVKEDEPKEKVKPVVLKEQTGDAYKILIKPQITEKATMLATRGKYVFQVHPDFNKAEIKRAIEKVYDVHVRKVNILTISGKARRYGRSVGRTKDWKKAVISVAKGERIASVTATEQA